MVSPILVIEFVAFVDFLGVGLFVPILMIYARKMGAGHIQLGLLRSVYSTFQLGSGPLLGSLSDLNGSKSVLSISLLMSSVCYILMGLTRSVYVLLLLRACLGLVKQTQMLTKAIVADYETNKQKQGEIYGKLIAASGAGMTLGPVIGGYVEETFPQHGYSVIAISVGLCFIFNAGIVLLMLPNPARCRGTRTNISGNIFQIFTRSIQQSFLALFQIKWSQYGDIFMYKALIGFAMGVYYAIYAALLRDVFKLTPKYIGGIMSYQNIIGSVSCCFICYINRFYSYDTDYSTRTLHVFILLTSAYLGLFFATNIVFYIFWLVPLALGNSVSRILILEMVINRSHGAHRGKLIGASNSVSSLSGVVSPMIAGMIGEWLGIGYVIYVSFISTLIGLMMCIINKHRRIGNFCCDCVKYD